MQSHALAVLSAVAYGAADFLGGLGAKRSGILSVVVVSQLVGLLLVLIATAFFPSAPAASDLVWGATGGLAGACGLALLYRGLATGTMSVVAPVSAICAVLLPLCVGAILGERPSPLQWLGIALAVVAIVLISRTTSSGTGRATGLGLAIASGLSIGIFLVCLERTTSGAGLWPLVSARTASVLFLSLGALASRRSLSPARGSLPTILGCGAIDMTANVLYLLAVREGQLGIVATLTSLYPASTILLARFVLGERLTGVQRTGVLCACAAIVLIVS